MFVVELPIELARLGVNWVFACKVMPKDPKRSNSLGPDGEFNLDDKMTFSTSLIGYSLLTTTHMYLYRA